ncbi:MAG: transcriptional regulator, partial [Candidatus Binatia bacterium]
MSATLVRETEAAYRRLRRFVPLGVLRSEKDYQKAVAILDEIIDEIGQNETHPLADLAEALAMFIHAYEETHAKIHDVTGPEMLRSLMEEHGLTQSE